MQELLLLANERPDGPSWSPYLIIGLFIAAAIAIGILGAPGHLRKEKRVQIVAGALIALLGLALTLFGPRFSAAVGSRAGRRFQSSNTLAFRLLGPVLVVLGLLYAAGLLG